MRKQALHDLLDLLFGGVGVARENRSFRLLANLLDGLSEEILSRYRFGSEFIEYLANFLKLEFEWQTAGNHAM